MGLFEMSKKKTPKKQKKTLGRPTKYKIEYNNIAKSLASRGCKDIEIAEAFQVNEDTIHEWKKVYPDFSEFLKQGKEQFDSGEVENALLKSAMGFKRVVQKLDRDGIPIEILEEVPPHPTSLIFWLKNRQPVRWRDKQEVEHQGIQQPIINIITKDNGNK